MQEDRGNVDGEEWGMGEGEEIKVCLLWKCGKNKGEKSKGVERAVRNKLASGYGAAFIIISCTMQTERDKQDKAKRE